MVEQSSEQPAPYGGTSSPSVDADAGASASASASASANDEGSSAVPRKRVRIPHLQEMKERGEKWAMLTAYDMYAAATFDEAGIPVTYTNVFWGGRSEIKPSEVLPGEYERWCHRIGIDPAAMRDH